MNTDRDGVFVIHEHHATHLHWDMRLSMDGVLKSWALPKIPPTECGIKRLALQTQDHSLDYANFEGIIPKGLYGAGEVKIWDKGKYELITRAQNKIEFTLYGKKLKGTYVLFKFKKGGNNQWLFLKEGHKNNIKYQKWG